MPRTGSDRDRALRRLRRASAVAGISAGALVGVFAGLAAKAFPGHHRVHGSNARVSVTRRPATATPPPLVPVESQAAPSPPAAPPTPTPAAPVVSSGGS